MSEVLPAVGSNDKELSALVETVRCQCQPAARGAIESLTKTPTDAAAFAAVLYSALALDERAYTAKVLPLLTKSIEKSDSLAAARAVASALLADRKQIDAEALAKAVTDGVAGEDLTVLLAMACRRVDGEAWSTYRSAAAELIGQQPLSGHVVVLLNRLGAAQFPSLAQR